MGSDLVGVAEIAAMLGVSRQRVNQLAGVDGFPSPVADLSAGRIWSRGDVESWMAGQESRVPAASLEEGVVASISDTLRRVMVSAQEAARRLRHGWIGTEHLLIGLLSTDGLTDVVAAAAKLDIQREAAEKVVTRLVPRGAEEVQGSIALTPRSYSSMGLAKGLAAGLGDPATEPRHLMMALTRETNGVAAAVMAELCGLSTDQVVSEMDTALRQEQQRPRVESVPPGKFKCTFCGKPQHQLKKLIAGPGVFICDECVGLCNQILGDDGITPPLPIVDAAQRLDALAAELAKVRKLLGGST